MSDRIVIIGGGLAGLAAATALAPRGFHITLLESRNRLGGRASSFQDGQTGELVDACQHVNMGCCTNFSHFCRTVGIDHLLEPQRDLYFMTPDRRVSRFRGDSWPAPLHLLRSFAGAHFLTGSEKLRIGWGLACLRRDTVVVSGGAVSDELASLPDAPFTEWLARHRQTARTVSRFWGLVLTSALNETCDRVGLRYARKVFLDGFLRHPRGFEIQIPSVPLGRLYGAELQCWLERHGVRVELQQAVKRVEIRDERVAGLVLRNDEHVQADWYIAAVPFDRLLDLLPPEIVAGHPCFANLRRLETSPITSVHLWFDRPVLNRPHVVLVDCLGQWIFNRGMSQAGEHYVQVVVSAARGLRALGHEEIERRITAELLRLFPATRSANLRRVRVVTEHQATFSAVPGVDQWRPAQASPIPNLLLAGDWTATGWPATMEGAVRSGYLAAQAVLARVGVNVNLVQPDLGS